MIGEAPRPKQLILLPIVLLLSLYCLAITGCGMQNTGQNDDPPDGPVQTDPASLEQSVVNLINQHRAGKNLRPLAPDERIAGPARKHSRDMASGSVPFSHVGFDQRVAAAGIPCLAAAENTAMNAGYADPAAVAVQGWLKSPGHRANIEGDYNLTGVGAAKNAKGEYYFTQIFLKAP